MRRIRGQIVLAVLFGLFALNAWLQVGFVAVGRSDDPPLLTVLQGVIGAAGAAASWGSWRAAPWAPVAAAGYSVVTAGMLLSLGPMLDLEAEARGGLWGGAVAVLAFGLWGAWYLRRIIHRAQPAAAVPPAV